MKGNTQRYFVPLIAAFILLIDQGTKAIAQRSLIAPDGSFIEKRIVGSALTLHLAYNSGAAFSLATNQTILLSLFSLLVALLIVKRSRSFTSLAWKFGAALIIGGIAGNISDRAFRAPRLLRGEVVDWIHLAHWPTFNLADSSIVTRAALVVALIARGVPSGGSHQGTSGESNHE